jgi:hypothetical protein
MPGGAAPERFDRYFLTAVCSYNKNENRGIIFLNFSRGAISFSRRMLLSWALFMSATGSTLAEKVLSRLGFL